MFHVTLISLHVLYVFMSKKLKLKQHFIKQHSAFLFPFGSEVVCSGTTDPRHTPCKSYFPGSLLVILYVKMFKTSVEMETNRPRVNVKPRLT